MKKIRLLAAILFCWLQFSYAQPVKSNPSFGINRSVIASTEVGSPSTLPDVKYHLTARPWEALNISNDDYLNRVEG